MKPRPIFFITSARPSGAFANLQCRRTVHIRAIAPALSCHMWHDGSRRRVQYDDTIKRWEGYNTRHASTSTAAASKTTYGRAPAPSPPTKASKTNVPAETTYSSRLAPASQSSSPPVTVPARLPESNSTMVPTVKAKEKLNPPPFTYAPEIALPARKADQSIVSWLWKTGRAYLTFYKEGLGHVRQTGKLAKQLRQKAEKERAGRDASEVLTRAEWQIIRRSRTDMLRLPAMGVLILLLGEWLPLVVMYITPLIPEPCRIPQQVKRDLTKRENRRADRLRRISLDTFRLQMASEDKHLLGPGNMKAENMSHFELMFSSVTHDCHSSIWDWFHITPPKFLLQRNVRQKLEYLAKDNALIERDGGFAALNKEEVERACVERGFDVIGKKEEDLRKALAKA